MPLSDHAPGGGRKPGRPKTRRLFHKVCEHCKIEFDTPNEKAKYHTHKCSSLAKRKVKVRPSREVLLKQIEELGWEGTARFHGVTYNAVKFWVREYDGQAPS